MDSKQLQLINQVHYETEINVTESANKSKVR